MRVLAALATLALLTAAAPALAHGPQPGGRGLFLDGLVMTFDPLTQNMVLGFNLTNDPTGGATGSIYGSLRFIDGLSPQDNNVYVGPSLDEGQTMHYEVSYPRIVSPKACIYVRATAAHVDKASNFVCAQTSGLRQAPTSLPPLPSAHDIQDFLGTLLP